MVESELSTKILSYNTSKEITLIRRRKKNNKNHSDVNNQ